MKAEEPEAVKGAEEESEESEENKVQKKKIGFREKRVRIILLLYTGLFSPQCYFRPFHLQMVSPSLEFVPTKLCYKRLFETLEFAQY